MTKRRWRTSEVIAFLEDQIMDGVATEEMEVIYQDYKWTGKVNRKSYEWKSIIALMKKLYNEKNLCK